MMGRGGGHANLVLSDPAIFQEKLEIFFTKYIVFKCAWAKKSYYCKLFVYDLGFVYSHFSEHVGMNILKVVFLSPPLTTPQ